MVRKKSGELPALIVMGYFSFLSRFALAHGLRQLYRAGRQFIRGEIVDVDAAQSAGFRTDQDVRLV
jgi:hypothetical protein